MKSSNKEREFEAKAAEKLAAMSHPLRLHMVRELANGEMRNVKSFVDETGVSQPAVSQHLARLRTGGVVEMTKEGTRVYYRVEDPIVRQIIEAIFPGTLKKEEE